MEGRGGGEVGPPQRPGYVLTREQKREAQKVLADRTPGQLKLPYALWNREAVRELILRRYQLKRSVRGVENLSETLGLHSAEAAAQGIRTEARKGAQMA